MPMNSLSDENKALLSLASRNYISTVFESLYSNFKFQEWVHNNVYSEDTIEILENHIANNKVDHNELAKYIAASTPNHCMDGWGFLGRAINCLIRGDSNVARHLAYYAELRAAMSILASVGIGVFNTKHVVIDENGSMHAVPANKGKINTHLFTWLAIEHWSKTEQAAELIGNIVNINTYSLMDWLEEFGASGNLAGLASNWLENWGIDLERLTNDRDARNKVSYRPSHTVKSPLTGVLERSRFIYGLWNNLNPYQTTRFDHLDRYLLRKSLKIINQGAPLYDSLGNHVSFDERVSKMLSKFPLTEAMIDSWKDFLNSDNYPDPIILSEAEQARSYDDPKHPFEVISRATLLLRIATGSCSQLINDATFTSSDLEFWWKNLGVERGLWSNRKKPGNQSGDIISLWDDVEVALEKIDSWNGKVIRPSNAGFIRNNSSLRILESCERIGLWGLVP